MKTISDILFMCFGTMGEYHCNPSCELCDKWRFCHVNTVMIACGMIFTTGEYH